MEELFDLPFQTKQLCVSDRPLRGYKRLSLREGLSNESILIDDANVAENIEQRLTKIVWPRGNSNFSKTLFSYSELASGLEKKIRRMILECFGVEKYADELIDSTNYMTKHGEWISVKPSPDSFIVMTGESLTVWLNGRLPSVNHRVMVTQNKARYFVGLFAAPKGGY
ncbi:Oxoglutarate/iron-dependent dioxygenase [Corchorus olitorius]|uniref:Oxoglutarate/iron-dependent dioxygenase n=1 Tax=Corchorus olitorius TaxID=93759 RepID=A0A1R3KE30_9ROSI|nr:Oxoglutarate/iron-dependent dioxygenase [Corchorus olitorius]